ncbi:MAG: hypothetical protein R2827_09835 [Bdellovibrionales bacterium]
MPTTDNVLIPLFDLAENSEFKHLQFHNGTVWKWNRPVIGFSGKNNDEPHIRIEHRPLSAGPTMIDCVANMCFFIGLTQHLANSIEDFEIAIRFS